MDFSGEGFEGVKELLFKITSPASLPLSWLSGFCQNSAWPVLVGIPSILFLQYHIWDICVKGGPRELTTMSCFVVSSSLTNSPSSFYLSGFSYVCGIHNVHRV